MIINIWRNYENIFIIREKKFKYFENNVEVKVDFILVILSKSLFPSKY